MVEESTVLQAMRQATEPATGITLFDLGFIDGVSVDADSVHITVVPHCNCPFLPILLEDLYDAASGVPGVEKVDIEVNWEVKWHPGMMTENGRKQLGLKCDE